jgi:hypothetical protein
VAGLLAGENDLGHLSPIGVGKSRAIEQAQFSVISRDAY